MSVELGLKLLSGLISNAQGSATEAGKVLAHNLFPEDFEYYLIGLELVQQSGIVTDRLIFPVTPDSITINDSKVTTVKKTAAGVASYTNNSYVPLKINLSGTFGRRMRLLLGNKKTEADFKRSGKDFLAGVKTGYGVTRELQRIYDKATTLDATNRPYRTHLYLYPYSTSYLVEFGELQLTQAMENNMFWKYNLNFTTLAPAEVGQFKEDAVKFGLISTINKSIDATVRDVGSTLGSLAAAART